jgi:hypothetical protein
VLVAFRQLAALAAVLVLCELLANARVIPLGVRSASLGMATVASGDDGAMPYLNPAGLANITTDTLALSASLYLYQYKNRRRWFAPGPPAAGRGELRHTDADWVGTSFDGMPTSISYMLHLGDGTRRRHHVIAFSVLAPDSQRFDSVLDYDFLLQGGPAMIGGRQSFEHAYARDLMLAGPSYALRVNRLLKVGLSAFYAYYRNSVSTNQQETTFVGNGADFASAVRGGSFAARAHGLLFELGAQLDLAPLFLGLAFQPPGIHLKGSFENTFKDTLTQPAALGARIVQEDASGRFTVRHPLSVRVGAGVKVRRWSLELAASLSAPSDAWTERRGTLRRISASQLKPMTSVTEELVDRRPSRTVVNGALGVEFAASERWTFRGGVFTDFDRSASLPADPTTDDLGRETIDYLGALLGLSYGGTRAGTSVALGFAYGFGRVVASNTLVETGANPATPIDVRALNLMIVVGGELAIGPLAGR